MTTDTILDTAELLIYKRGYGYVSMKDFADEAQTTEDELREKFPNEALICTAWLKRKDDNSDKIHTAILLENKPASQKVDEYFVALADYMKQNQFRGCPFSNVAAQLSEVEKEKQIREIIVKHKQSLKEFLIAIAIDITPEKADLLGETLFLLYSGATTESRNISSIDPVYTARTSASMFCQLYM